MKPISLLPIALVLAMLPSTAKAATFKCAATNATCQSVAGYIPANATSLKEIQLLFQVPTLIALLGANGLPPTTPPSHRVAGGATVNVPFPCRCSNGTGVSDGAPIYTVKPTDTGLDAIARSTFAQFVTYQEIGEANRMKDVNVITPGERLRIPLPCSCDPVGGEAVVHLGHVTAPGSTVGGIAEEFGTTEEVLRRLNGMTDPKYILQAGQVLDVPLKACASNISSDSLDHGLLLPNGSYAVTAENCIQCTCSSSSNYQLSCNPIQGLSKSQCPAVPKCGNLFIGNSTSDGCKQTTCSYQGYTNATGLNILSGPVTVSTCSDGAPSPQPAAGNPPQPIGNTRPSGNFGGRLRLEGNQIVPLLLLQIALFWFSL